MKDLVKELLGKFTRYDWFTTLIPGVFCMAVGVRFGIFNFVSNSLLERFGMVFFLGLISSRIGASMIEPIFKIKRFKLWGKYEDYMNFRTMDEKGADMLVMNANWFRSLMGMVILLLAISLVNYVWEKFGWGSVSKRWASLLGLLILFGDSYRRQLGFMFDRINYYKGRK